MPSQTRGLLIMGVAGSGKTTIGSALAKRLGWQFFDADDFHAPENIARMSAGIPLTDEDRAPWLVALHGHLSLILTAGQHPILACSALKASYRKRLLTGLAGIAVIYLQGSPELIMTRLTARQSHFMNTGLLQSQFDALEEPENALLVEIDRPADEIIQAILVSLGLP